MLKKGKSKMSKSFPNLKPGEVPAIQKEHMKTTAGEKKEIRRRHEEEVERKRLAELERQRQKKLRLEQERQRQLELARQREEVRRKQEALQQAAVAKTQRKRTKEIRLAQTKKELEEASKEKRVVCKAFYQLGGAHNIGYTLMPDHPEYSACKRVVDKVGRLYLLSIKLEQELQGGNY